MDEIITRLIQFLQPNPPQIATECVKWKEGPFQFEILLVHSPVIFVEEVCGHLQESTPVDRIL